MQREEGCRTPGQIRALPALIGICEGYRSEPEACASFDRMMFDSGVAQLDRSLAISIGLRLTRDHSDAVLNFLKA